MPHVDGPHMAVQFRGVTFANRPTGVTPGTIAYFTDSNTATNGATVAGGGGNAVLAKFDGTNWKVLG